MHLRRVSDGLYAALFQKCSFWALYYIFSFRERRRAMVYQNGSYALMIKGRKVRTKYERLKETLAVTNLDS